MARGAAGVDVLTGQDAAAAGEGTVSAAEVFDERGHAYEVEVARADGRTTDVALDADLPVVVVEGWHH